MPRAKEIRTYDEAASFAPISSDAPYGKTSTLVDEEGHE